MAEDHIRYDILTQDALRGVVKKVLTEISRTGLPGDHHFFISFATRATGVRISQRLLDQYDSEMTIVLQNQFWDLKVNETGFEVALSFDGISETLVIPYAALKGFFDPSVQFGLTFDASAGDATSGKTDKVLASVPDSKSAEAGADTEEDGDAQIGENDENSDAEESGEKVVSLDAFRKKP